MIAGVLLAAGAGTRFGGRKLLFPLSDGTPLGVAALRNLKSSMQRVIAVVRGGDDELRVLLEGEHVAVIECPDADRGMGHSLAAAIAAESRADGWVIALGDMPYILPTTIGGVVQALERGAELVVPAFAGQRGHPVGFGRRFREDLLRSSGDAGARTILKTHALLVQQLDTDDPGTVQDVDTPADAVRLAR